MDDAKQIAIARWLAKAENDLTAARTLLETDPPITDIACFHAQQCAEKALKAFLVLADIHVEKTHYLPRLVELCFRADPSFQNLKDAASELTDYAVASRYPDEWRDIPCAEAIEAVRLTEIILNFVQGKVCT
ncbi:MAG: HEPN domain-containing protein [Gammaproteobacteria bacterium]